MDLSYTANSTKFFEIIIYTIFSLNDKYVDFLEDENEICCKTALMYLLQKKH